MNNKTTRPSLLRKLTAAAMFLLLMSNSFLAAADSIDIRVAASTDDAEESASGSLYLNSSDLELTFDRNSYQTVGMRFTNVAIPAGATIDKAYIQFNVDETNTVDTSLVIHGELTGSAETYVKSHYNITGRTPTSASVAWNLVPPWDTVHAEGQDQQTPDITDIVQEIVDQGEWSSGNALAIMITGTGERTAESYDGTSSAAPLLHVEFTTGPPVNKAPVVEAGANKIVVLPEDSVSLSDASVTDDGLPSASVTIAWTLDSATVAGDVTFSPDASAQNPTATFPASGTYVLRLSADDGELVASDTVTVEVKPEGSVPTVIEKRVGQSADDAEEQDDSRVSLTSSDLELVFDRNSNQDVGIRFTDLDLPRGALIEKAYIQFTVDETNSGNADLQIQGEFTGNAGNFTTSYGDISSRTPTSAAVAWSPPDWNNVGEQGMAQQTPDISPVVQEIVNHPDWYSGNSLAIIITGTGERTAESYDGDAANAALLHVEFSGGDYSQPFRTWGDLGITFDELDLAVDTENKRLFVPLGTGFGTPQNYNPVVNYDMEDQGYALGFNNGPVVASGGSPSFFVEYGSTASAELYQDGELIDSYTLVFNNLPMVVLKADSIVDEPKLPGRFHFISGEYNQELGEYNMGIEFRGQTSQAYPKKSFAVEVRKSDGIDEKNIEPLDLRKDGDWLMDATYRDTSFVRNIVSHDIFNDMRPYAHVDSLGIPRGQATIRGHEAEVVLNESYHGVYIFEEKVDRKLLNLDKIDVPEDEFGNKLWDQVDWSNPANGSVMYKAEGNNASLEPLSNVSSEWQQDYPDIDDVVHWGPLEDFIDFVNHSSDAEFISTVGDLVDIDNVVDYWLLTNVTGNRDTLKKNYYLVRNASDKWFIVPWDYDAAFGMYWDGSPYPTDSWWDPGKNYLVGRLSELTETGFNARAKVRWNELRATIFTEEALIARFIDYRNEVVPVPGNPENARNRNFARWPESGGEGVDNPELGTIAYIQDWIHRRLEFLDEEILSQPE
jgi:spore coat protein CotH